MSPALSVVIPVHDGARTLARSIESVLAQGEPVEILVVDDASTDGSAAIAARYPEVRLLGTAGPGPAGPATARNLGIAAARGALLAFNDADDAWLPDKLRLQLAALEAEPTLEVVLCAFANVADGDFPFPAWARPDRARQPLPGFIFQAMLARRPVFDRVGPLDPAMSPADDTDWFLRAHDLGVAMRQLPEVLVRRYLHDRNLSADVVRAQKALVRAVHASVRRRR